MAWLERFQRPVFHLCASGPCAPGRQRLPQNNRSSKIFFRRVTKGEGVIEKNLYSRDDRDELFYLGGEKLPINI